MKPDFRQAFRKEGIFIATVGILFITPAFFFHDSLFGDFGQHNYLTIHLIIEMLIIISSFSIAIQAWLTFPHILSNRRIWIGALFFSVGILELLHTITYKGMPFFITESSPYKATWFYMIDRLILALGTLIVIVSKERKATPHQRWLVYALSCLFAFVWSAIIFNPAKVLPELVIDGQGTTVLKNSLQVLAIAIQLGYMLIIIRYYKVLGSIPESYPLVISATVCLIIGDSMFVTYKSVFDLTNFIGHLFQFGGFYFFLRAFHHISVEEPFYLQKKAEEQLRVKERFLYMITSQIGDGVIVMGPGGVITFINPKSTQLLNCSEDELVGQPIQSLFPHFSEFLQEELRDEVQFLRKDGTVIWLLRTITPYVEAGGTMGFIMVIYDISEQKKARDYITHMAYHDELTTLPNSRYFEEKISEELDAAPDRAKAVLVLNIDRFRNMNEALGHSFGDLVLQSVAHRLRESLSAELFLSRMSGEQFSVLIGTVENEDHVFKVCREIQLALKEPMQVQQLLLNVTLSIGIALYPQHGADQTELMKRAQIAMHEAQKESERFKLYAPFMDQQFLNRLVLENDLHQAIARNELQLVYQPQTDLHTGDIVSLEALIRWRHPRLGWITPAKFIPIAEEIGLIIPIGEWVLRTACKQLKQWHDQGFPHMAVAVNLSTRQFFQHNLVSMVEGILQETGLPPQYLELEITESLTMNVSDSLKILSQLKQIGVSIAIDDFGTGYSSLHYLKELPIDRIKIDQSFIRDLETNTHDAAIISMIVSIARHLQIHVIAEGVEHLEQLHFLREQQCRQMQGFLVSRPISADELTADFYDIQSRAVTYCKTARALNLAQASG